MKKNGLVKKIIDFIKDPNREFSERVFLIFTMITESAVIIALIGDIYVRESIGEIITILAIIILVPAFTIVCLYKDRLRLAIRVIVIGLVFGIVPSLFFFGGGLNGGGFLWIIFAFMYIGLVLTGKWRTVMLSLLVILTLVCYLVSYHYPSVAWGHSVRTYHIDSFISVVLVGMACFAMTMVQNILFKYENDRAKREAERAEELTRTQNRFFSSMSHEIRTPINSILGLNELILRDESASDDVIRDANGIQGAGKLLLSLINDLLDFSKIEAGSMDIVPVDYNVGNMLSEIVNMIWLKAHEKGLGFEVSIDPDVPMVLYGDEVRIKQIIINMLNNAVKYTKKGQVELHIESKDTDDKTAELTISVSDTGMGIKKEDIPFLFDAFKRVDEGKNRHIEGTGLGLSIVKQLVELMDGTITVNSVYGEGSTFTVVLKQTISDHNRVGDLNIHNQTVNRSKYESSFLAPEVRILIVDDNEMNLEVEKRLLKDTDMTIDTALSGKDALDLCQKVHYDAVFMDHLMPAMDGIECLALIRDQAGGLNRNTPVIVLTANAGSENRELYNRSGFDGYLVKPVSGEAMEEMLIRHISRDKIILRSVMVGDDEEIRTSERYAEKTPVIIASSSMCDLPDSVVRKLHIPVLPFVITTDEGVFRDGVHMDANELVRYIGTGGAAVSSPPDESEYTVFFSDLLKRTHHIIYISITTGMSKDYATASEAAKAFDNVTVINSECLSSATGILVLIACKLAQQGMPVQDIISELNEVKYRLKCSFVIDTTKFMADRKLISIRLHKVAEAFNLHPALSFRNDRAGLGGVWLGRTKRAYRRYISRALPPDTIPDSDICFVTYVDIPGDTLDWIESEIKKTAYFEHVIFKQASAAISSNCGPGTFGILYFLKSNKSYNIASFVDDARDLNDMKAHAEEEDELFTEDIEEVSETESELWELIEPSVETEVAEAGDESGEELKWYQKLDCIDAGVALKNSGSEEAFKTVLQIFYDSIPDKHADLEKYYSSGDWENYTIKIHALKSSARLIGATELGEMAEALEMAGKGDNISYIKENHEPVMEYYMSYREALSETFEKAGADQKQDKPDKPVADAGLMESIYEELRVAADDMDCEKVGMIMKEAEEYAIPDQEKEKFELIREKAKMLDYDGILEALE
ncbi:MAG: DegV family EDD domain-containing protein [Lachnospiraceae bacterium]|nr:DegV family EDD domain-containing protein [Lachnospiraceae bacterium]